jgi:hypothetical protein
MKPLSTDGWLPQTHNTMTTYFFTYKNQDRNHYNEDYTPNYHTTSNQKKNCVDLSYGIPMFMPEWNTTLSLNIWMKKKRWFQFSHCELSFSSTCIYSICLLVFSGVYVAQSAVFCVVLCWPLYWLSFKLQFLNLWNLQSFLSSFLFLI